MSETNKQSLSDIAYQKLKNMLVNLELRPGGAITEIQLMENLGMSRTPIRQALQRLAQEEFVSLAPHKGWFVCQVSVRDIQEFFVVREAIEGIAARLAAELISEETLHELNAIAEKADKEAEKSDDFDACDVLHQKIFEAVNNQQINRIISLYEDHLKRFHIMACHLPGRLILSYKEHCEVLKALTARDGEKAELAMREHIRSSRRSLLEAILNGNVI